MPRTVASETLRRFTVLDLTQVRSGPTAVRQLADWGADVVKIEIPGGDRGLGGPRHGSDFQNLHRNKRSLTLDLKSPEGRAAFDRMVERADVVVENFRPAVKERLGIGYADLRAVNRRIVLASISGFGQSGPYRDRPGFDQIAQGLGGLMSVTGEAGRGPMRAGIPVADLCAGLLCAQAILLALLERETSGEGQWVHTSLLEAQIFMLDFQSARWLQDAEVPGQAGNDHPTVIPTGVFETADGHVNISVAGEPMWRAFCQAIGAPELAVHADYATLADRSRNREPLHAAIGERTRTAKSGAWVERLNAAGVPCGPILAVDAVFEDPQVRSLAMVESVASPALGELRMTRQPFVLERTGSHLANAPPERGEHTEEVLAQFGFDAEEIARLRAQGAI